MINYELSNRTILHSDLNNFFASVECALNPKLQSFPVAVAGDPKMRRGVVLAKNSIAKKYGIQTGEALFKAQQKCPEIVFVRPHMEKYIEYSKKVRDIYYSYTNQVESFGIDECWLDVTGSTHLFGNGCEIAQKIRNRVKKELGITVSIGVSFNKIFAKLGSDMKKPDAVTVISQNNFKNKIWSLPIENLLYIGKSAKSKLYEYGINTIGKLASTDPLFLKNKFGKNGYTLWIYANGFDNEKVAFIHEKEPIKSISNSTTTCRDMVCEQDVKIALYSLCESVAQRLRASNLKASTIQLSLRTSNLKWFERQTTSAIPLYSADEIFDISFKLFKDNNILPLRSIGIRAANLFPAEFEQLSFDSDILKVKKHESLDKTIDKLKNKFDRVDIKRAVTLISPELAKMNSHIQKREIH